MTFPCLGMNGSSGSLRVNPSNPSDFFIPSNPNFCNPVQSKQVIQTRNFEGLISTPDGSDNVQRLGMFGLPKFTRIAGIDKKHLDCNN